MKGITPCLWFDDQAEAAARFYVSIFRNSKIKSIGRCTGEVSKHTGKPPGSVLTVSFQIFGQEFLAMNGGPAFKMDEAVSFIVNCETQREVDRYWDKLSAGGEESQCGWLKDRFGVSWQIVPTLVGRIMGGPDPARVERLMRVVLKMTRPDINEMKRAVKGARRAR